MIKMIVDDLPPPSAWVADADTTHTPPRATETWVVVCTRGVVCVTLEVDDVFGGAPYRAEVSVSARGRRRWAIVPRGVVFKIRASHDAIYIKAVFQKTNYRD